MALSKTMDKYQKPRRKITTKAITHAYMYRQIAMMKQRDTKPRHKLAKIPSSKDTNRQILDKDVLALEATQAHSPYFSTLFLTTQ